MVEGIKLRRGLLLGRPLGYLDSCIAQTRLEYDEALAFAEYLQGISQSAYQMQLMCNVTVLVVMGGRDLYANVKQTLIISVVDDFFISYLSRESSEASLHLFEY
jgi:hypothetical protein